jgi:hypothetical protein
MAGSIPTYRLGPDFVDKLDAFVERFLSDGYDHFADEFLGIEEFVAKARSEDGPEKLRQTPKEKYLLELVNFGLLDRLNRDAFNARKNTVIMMPDCLGLHNPDCEKADHPHGDICRRCTESCQAYHITELGREFRVRTVFSKRKLTQQLEGYEERLGDLSVIGVACINMLAEGMRAAGEAGVPARGVLLNFSGCEHWQDKPCASEFSMDRLRDILVEKYGPAGEK